MVDALSDVPTAPIAAVERFRLDVPGLGDDAVWSRSEGFSVCGPTQEQTDAVMATLRLRGLALRSLVAVRHEPGERGLPRLAPPEGWGFVVDLSEARRTIDGGLLLFAPASGPATGWRAEVGAMTLWHGADPELTELAPGAPPRISLVGRAAPE